MRIVHVVVSDAFAGVEAHVARLANAQASRGHDVVVVGGAVTQVQAAAGPDVRVVAGDGLAVARRAAVTHGASADVVHAHMTAAEVVCASLPRVLLGRVPLVATRHFALRRGQSTLGRMTRPLVARAVDAQLAISAFTAGHIDGPATVVLPGVADGPDRPARQPGGDGPRTVLMVQRLEAEKHPGTGVRAFAASGLAAHGWRLLVAGDGSLRDDVAALAAALGVADAVDLLGHRTDVPDLLAAASVFLAPTPSEGLGLSVLEAMAAGLPVVADGSGGHLETLGADARGLYATGDADAAGRALARIGLDPAGAAEYGAALQARQRARFSLAHQAEATDAVYRRVVR